MPLFASSSAARERELLTNKAAEASDGPDILCARTSPHAVAAADDEILLATGAPMYARIQSS